MMKEPKPPKLLLRFFRWFCHPDLVKYIEGDLIELFEERRAKSGQRRAKRQLAWDVVKLFRPSIIKPADGTYRINNYGMFKNYFKVGIRNILKHKGFSFINVFGLAVSLSVSMLIILMIVNQMSSDQFHEKRDQIYRIIGHTEDSTFPYASTAFPLATTLKAEYPIVEEAVQLMTGVGADMTYEDRSLETRGFFTGPEFFKVFSFELEKGDKHSALSAPNSIVISSEYARFLFKEEVPIGKTVRLLDRQLEHLGSGSNSNKSVDWGFFTVTGVIAEKEYKSHLKFDILVSSASLKGLYSDHKKSNLSTDWLRFYECYTYVVINERANNLDLNTALEQLVSDKYTDDIRPQGFYLSSQHLSEISPGPFMAIPIGIRMPIEAYYALAFFALIIMSLACLNYTNLSIARALTRAKEIGIRKVNGGNRASLIYQFICESMLMAFFALMVAFIMLIGIKAAFMNLWINKYLDFDLHASLPIYLAFFVFAMIIGVISGIYPALYLSKLAPLKVLKNIENIGRGKIRIRKALMVSQFAVSLLFIVTSILIYNQVKYFLQFEYGFRTENIVNVELQSNDYAIMLNEFGSVPGLTSISASSVIPASGSGEGQFIRLEESEEEHLLFSLFQVDPNFVENLELKLLAGGNLPESGSLSGRGVLINKSGAVKLGFQNTASAIGNYLEFKHSNQRLMIIGAVDDFQFKALFEMERDGPLILINNPEKFKYLNLSIATNNANATLEKLAEKWVSIDPVHPFKYEFFDKQLASMNALFEDVVSIIGFITLLAIIISCMGLFGMSIYTIERRTKEIGIRKVLGAEIHSIAIFISKEFLALLGVSIVVAAPISYFINNLWLENLPNRVDFGFEIVILGSLILLALGLITIISQTIKAASRNPVLSLRDE